MRPRLHKGGAFLGQKTCPLQKPKEALWRGHHRSPVPEIHTLAPEAGAGGPPRDAKASHNTAPAPAAIGLCSSCGALRRSIYLIQLLRSAARHRAPANRETSHPAGAVRAK